MKTNVSKQQWKYSAPPGWTFWWILPSWRWTLRSMMLQIVATMYSETIWRDRFWSVYPLALYDRECWGLRNVFQNCNPCWWDCGLVNWYLYTSLPSAEKPRAICMSEISNAGLLNIHSFTKIFWLPYILHPKNRARKTIHDHCYSTTGVLAPAQLVSSRSMCLQQKQRSRVIGSLIIHIRYTNRWVVHLYTEALPERRSYRG